MSVCFAFLVLVPVSLLLVFILTTRNSLIGLNERAGKPVDTELETGDLAPATA